MPLGPHAKKVRPCGTEASEQFPRDALDGVHAAILAIFAEPGQLACVFTQYGRRDALDFLVLKEDVNTGLCVPPLLLLGLYFGRASGELVLDFPFLLFGLCP